MGETDSDYDGIRLDPLPDAPGHSAPSRSAQPIPRRASDMVGSRWAAAEDCDGAEVGFGGAIECDDPTYPGGYGWHDRGLCGRLFNRFSLFAGVQGFKGPTDQGRNGNFGFHEGFNFGAPLGGPWGIGYQLGIQGVHSNFSGSQVVHAIGADRDQVFFTAGLFRRSPDWGLQWGVAFDALHDNYYEKADLTQIRTELSLIGFGPHEIGFWGALGSKNDQLSGATLEQTDLYTFFYRRHFSGGGEGRLWGGFSSNKDGLLGGDIRVPLGTSWALENTFNYLIPNESRGAEGSREESWSVGLQLVWYPGRSARCIRHDLFQPLLNVADNSVFMVDYVH